MPPRRLLHVYCKRYIISRVVFTFGSVDTGVIDDPITLFSIASNIQVDEDTIAIALTNIDENNDVYVLLIPLKIAVDIKKEAEQYKKDNICFHYIDNMHKNFIVTYVEPNFSWKVLGPSSTTISSYLFDYLMEPSSKKNVLHNLDSISQIKT